MDLIIHLKEGYTYRKSQLSDNSKLLERFFMDIEDKILRNQKTLASIYWPPKINIAVQFSPNSMVKLSLLWTSCQKKPMITASLVTLTVTFKVIEWMKFQKHLHIFITSGLLKITPSTLYNLNRNTETAFPLEHWSATFYSFCLFDSERKNRNESSSCVQKPWKCQWIYFECCIKWNN